MKRLFTVFLIICAILAVQFLGANNVSAKAVINSPASSLPPLEQDRQFPIPKLVNLEQLSSNQIQITYDRDVAVKLATKTTNYWVQDTMNAVPKGIGTLGKNHKVNNTNSLTNSKVIIEQNNNSAKTFVLTFSQDIPKGESYKLIICYVTIEGAPPYSGDNGMATFVGK